MEAILDDCIIKEADVGGMNMDLSIIVPVYNVEAYLEKCLKSLTEQTLDKACYEIIVVNDGSPDNSQKIIDKFAEKFSNIIVLQKENGGLSDARNFGIQRARGKYVAFVDSDDYVDVRMYEEMLKKAKEKDFDMVVCDFKEVYENHIVRGTSRVKRNLLGVEEIRDAMMDFYPSAWNKIYKKELFAEVQFKKGIWFEDVECLYRLFPYVKSVGVVRESFYFYLQRSGSISKSTDPRIFDCIDNWNGILQYYEQKGYMALYRREIEFCYVRYIYATFMKAALKFEKEEFEKALNRALIEVHQHTPNYRGNTYFYKSLKGLYCVLFNKFVGKILYFLKK